MANARSRLELAGAHEGEVEALFRPVLGPGAIEVVEQIARFAVAPDLEVGAGHPECEFHVVGLDLLERLQFLLQFTDALQRADYLVYYLV